MQPLIRNTGEAMGVQSRVNVKAPLDEQRFLSSVPIKNLKWIEDFLSGDRPYPAKRFSGLLPPAWPKNFPEIDQQLAGQGRILYKKHCQGCHLPDLNSPEIWNERYFAPITYYKKDNQDQEQQTLEKLLRLKIIPIAEIGTDHAQASV